MPNAKRLRIGGYANKLRVKRFAIESPSLHIARNGSEAHFAPGSLKENAICAIPVPNNVLTQLDFLSSSSTPSTSSWKPQLHRLQCNEINQQFELCRVVTTSMLRSATLRCSIAIWCERRSFHRRKTIIFHWKNHSNAFEQQKLTQKEALASICTYDARRIVFMIFSKPQKKHTQTHTIFMRLCCALSVSPYLFRQHK